MLLRFSSLRFNTTAPLSRVSSRTSRCISISPNSITANSGSPTTAHPSNYFENSPLVLYVNHLFPLKWGRLDPIPLLLSRGVLKNFKLPPSFPKPVQMVPRIKDGGAFLYFDQPVSLSALNQVLRPRTLWSSYDTVHPVLGQVFNDDITTLTPSPRLRVELIGPTLTLEEIYTVYRPYGPITDLHYINSNKVEILFKNIRSATSARNCAYQLKVNDATTLIPHYEQFIKPRHVLSWLANHPRLVIPLALALFFAILVTIFNPIRIFFIESQLEGKWYHKLPFFLSLKKWWKSTESTLVTLESLPEGGMHRLEQLKKNLSMAPGALVYISGPNGSGKSTIAQWITQIDHAKQIKIDCDALIHPGRTSMDILRLLANQIGYFPFFHSLDRFWSYLDTALSASFGAKTGISVSDDTVLQNILDCAALALLSASSKRKKEEPYPVVIIEQFLIEKQGIERQFYDKLASWVGRLVELGIAHVILISNSNTETEVIRVMSQVLPSKPIDVVHVNDMSEDQAKVYLRKHLPGVAEKDLKEVVKSLGGRTHDLDVLIQKTHHMNLSEALEEMLQQAMVEMYKYGFETHRLPLWYLLPLLPIQYDQLIGGLPCLDSAFLDSMESKGLIDIVYKHGRPQQVTFPKPLYQAALRRLQSDPSFVRTMDRSLFSYLLRLEQSKLKSLLDEYIPLSSKTIQTCEGTLVRLRFLGQQIEATQKKIDAYLQKLKSLSS